MTLLFDAHGAEIDLGNFGFRYGSSDPSVKLTGGNIALVSYAYSETVPADQAVAIRVVSPDGSVVAAPVVLSVGGTPNIQRPTLAADPSGGFVLVWEEPNPASIGNLLLAQRYDAAAAPQGAQVTLKAVSSYSNGIDATVLDDGTVAVAASHHDYSSGLHSASVSLLAADGSVSATPTPLVSGAAAGDADAKIVALGGGKIAATWIGAVPPSYYGPTGDVWVQILNADGTSVGPATRANSDGLPDKDSTDITLLSDGRFVVNWQSASFFSPDPVPHFAQIFNPDGTPSGAPIELNAGADERTYAMTLVALTDGAFAAIWTTGDQNAPDPVLQLQGQIVAADGSFQGQAFDLPISGDLSDTSVLPDGNGGFSILWEEGIYTPDELNLMNFAATTARVDGLTAPDITLSEVQTSGFAIETLIPDAPLGSTLTYTILSDPSGAFTIDGDRIVLSNNAGLDFETAPSFVLTLRATDQNGNTADTALSITVTDDAAEDRYAALPEEHAHAQSPYDNIIPHISGSPDGGYWMAWQTTDDGDDTTYAATAARRFGPDGTPATEGITLHSPQANANESEAVILGLPDGGALVAWTAHVPNPDGFESLKTIETQRLDANGQTLGGVNTLASTNTQGRLGEPTLTALDGGAILATWVTTEPIGYWGSGITMGQMLSPDGTAEGSAFEVKPDRSYGNEHIQITALSDGGFATVEATNAFEAPYGIELDLFSADGTKIGPSREVVADTGENAQRAKIACGADGNLLIVWIAGAASFDDTGIAKGRIFDTTTNSFGPEFTLMQVEIGVFDDLSVVALKDGGYLVAWESDELAHDQHGTGLAGHLLDASGAPRGEMFGINAETQGSQTFPAYTALAEGGFAAAWTTGAADDTDGDSIQTRAFAQVELAPQNPVAQVYADGTYTTLLSSHTSLHGAISAATQGQAIDIVDASAIAALQTQIISTEGLTIRTPAGVTATFDLYAAQSFTLAGVSTAGIAGSGQSDTLTGSEGANAINAEGGDDLVHGGGGNDTIKGFAGADTLYGNEGDDSIWGGPSGDRIDGGAGNDSIDAAGGDDPEVRGGAGDDTLEGGGGRDQLLGDAGRDVLLGGNANDTLFGGEDDDRLYGQLGRDSLDGGIGNDTLTGGNANDTLIGGAGDDRLLGQGSSDLMEGGAGRDTMDGGASADVIHGGDDDDSMMGGAYNDLLFGEAGQDVLQGGSGRDTLDGGAGGDTLDGGSGNDTAHGGAGDDLVSGGIGSDSLTGGAGADSLLGGAANDTLEGGAGADVLDGGSGSDRLLVGAGEGGDTLTGGAGVDSFVFASGFGGATIADFSAQDVIDLSGVAAAGGFGGLAISYGADASVDLGGGDVLTLTGITSGLSAADFLF